MAGYWRIKSTHYSGYPAFDLQAFNTMNTLWLYVLHMFILIETAFSQAAIISPAIPT